MEDRFKKERGFTMVELITAMSVFVILLTVAVGIFARTIRTQRSLVYRMGVNNNAGLVLEQIAREVRTGYFFCEDRTSACDISSTSSIKFTNYKGEEVTYSWDKTNEMVERSDPDGTVKLTASDVSVKDLHFKVSQNSICAPWRVTIRMRVGSDMTDPERDVKLQTTVSSRVLPVETPNVSQEVLNNCQYD